MSAINHLNELEYNDASEQKIKVSLHDGRLYFRVRDDSTGDYDTPRSIQDKDILVLKDMYGANGYERNLCLKFALNFADAKPFQLLLANKKEIMQAITDESANENSLVTEMVMDASESGSIGFNIIFTVSYNPNDEPNLKTTDATSLYYKVYNPANLQAIFTGNVTAPFDTNVTLVTRDDVTPIILHKNVPAGVMKVELTDVGTGNDTQIDIVCVGNFDHWAVKYDTATIPSVNNDYIRIRNYDVFTHTYSGLNYADITKIYVTLFDHDYAELYTYSADAPITLGNIARRSVKNNYY